MQACLPAYPCNFRCMTLHSFLQGLTRGMCRVSRWLCPLLLAILPLATTFDYQDIRHLSDRQLTLFRAREMGFVFQTYNLLPVLTGLENVELPLLASGVSAKVARARALASIEQVGLRDWASQRPAEMSGGQRQRFAIARALATTPSLVWADEPTGALDSTTSQEIIDLMLTLNAELGLTFVWVTHALDIARQASRMITMSDGLISTDVLAEARAEVGTCGEKGAQR